MEKAPTAGRRGHRPRPSAILVDLCPDAPKDVPPAGGAEAPRASPRDVPGLGCVCPWLAYPSKSVTQANPRQSKTFPSVEWTELSEPEIARFLAAAALHRACCDPLIAASSSHARALTDVNQAICVAVRTITSREAEWIYRSNTEPVGSIPKQLVVACVMVPRLRPPQWQPC
jgi:hypothetical protein